MSHRGLKSQSDVRDSAKVGICQMVLGLASQFLNLLENSLFQSDAARLRNDDVGGHYDRGYYEVFTTE